MEINAAYYTVTPTELTQDPQLESLKCRFARLLLAAERLQSDSEARAQPRTLLVRFDAGVMFMAEDRPCGREELR